MMMREVLATWGRGFRRATVFRFVRESRRLRRVLLVGLLGGFVTASVGCGSIDYVLTAAAGQFDILFQSRPVNEVLDGGTLSEQQASRLRLILDVRQFGIDQAGLEAGGSYTAFYDTKGQPPAYNVTASKKDAFEPVTWTFPFVGTIPYLGFFSRDDAEALAKTLADQDFDVLVLAVGAYSTLGFFPDPIFSSMLDRNEVSLVDLILHEMTHNTVYRSGDTDFNESLATFIGRAASLAFLEARHGADSPLLDEARQRNEDADRYNAHMQILYDALDALYGSDISAEDKLAGRQAVYQQVIDDFEANDLPAFHDSERYGKLILPDVSNAWILANRRYNLDLDLFADVFDAVGQNFPAALEVFDQAADAKDPKTFLRDWVAEQAPK